MKKPPDWVAFLFAFSFRFNRLHRHYPPRSHRLSVAKSVVDATPTQALIFRLLCRISRMPMAFSDRMFYLWRALAVREAARAQPCAAVEIGSGNCRGHRFRAPQTEACRTAPLNVG